MRENERERRGDTGEEQGKHVTTQNMSDTEHQCQHYIVYCHASTENSASL